MRLPRSSRPAGARTLTFSCVGRQVGFSSGALVERAETFAFAHIVAIGAGCGEAELSTSRTFAEIFTVLCLCTFDRRTYATVTDDGLPATAVTVCVTCTIALAASAGCSCFDTDTILDETLTLDTAGVTSFTVIVCCDDAFVTLTCTRALFLAEVALFADGVRDDTALFFE